MVRNVVISGSWCDGVTSKPRRWQMVWLSTSDMYCDALRAASGSGVRSKAE
jgi:hypothetical protein